MKLKILFVNGNLAIGGVERALVNLLNGLEGEKYYVDLLLLQSGDAYKKEIKSKVNIIQRDTANAFGPFIPTIINAIRRKDSFTLGLRICLSLGNANLRFMKKALGINKKYDIAISFRPGFCEEIVLNAVSAHKKFAWWHHGDFNITSNIKRQIANWERFDKLITVSQGIANKIIAIAPNLQNQIEIVPNIINIEKIRRDSLEYNPYGKVDRFKIITVSRLSKEKNLPYIIDVAKELKNRRIDFEWNIVGDGEMRQLLENEITKNGLSNFVILQGSKDNPYPWIKYADLMFHPSKVESFGLVLLEAMAIGTLCISASSIGAINLIDDSNGIIIDDSIAQIAELITAICNNQFYIEKYREAGFYTANKYSAHTVIPTFLKVSK